MFQHAYLAAVIGCIAVAAASPARAAGTDSAALAIAGDVSLAPGKTILLSIPVRGGRETLFDGEGTYAPTGNGAIDIYVTLDGVKVSNDSMIDWRDSKTPVQHSFRAIDAHRVPPGQHVAALVAETGTGGVVRAGAEFAVMTDPARIVHTETLRGDSPTIHVATRNVVDHKDPLPTENLLDVDMKPMVGPVAVLAAGTSYYAGVGTAKASDYGDAMWALVVNGEEAPNNSGTYANNDICRCAETRAPMFVQGLLDGGNTPLKVALGASVAPWGKPDQQNEVIYRVESRTKLIVLDGLGVAGHTAQVKPGKQPLTFSRYPYRCLGSSIGWSGCPASGTDTVLASERITIPSGHNGVVFISSVLRSQGASKDPGGDVRLWLTVDGARRGSMGIQGYLHSGVSARTLTAAFLAAGPQALSVGNHVVEVHGSATGDFKHLVITQDLPLMWFD